MYRIDISGNGVHRGFNSALNGKVDTLATVKALCFQNGATSIRKEPYRAVWRVYEKRQHEDTSSLVIAYLRKVGE